MRISIWDREWNGARAPGGVSGRREIEMDPLVSARIMGSNWFFLTGIIIFGIWAVQSIITRIVDGVVKTKQARMDLERDYLAQMVSDLEEIKARLDQQEYKQNA
jgi:hypothetical protein